MDRRVSDDLTAGTVGEIAVPIPGVLQEPHASGKSHHENKTPFPLQ